MASFIYGQKRVNTFTSGDQLAQKMTPLADGGYLLVWTSVGQYQQADIFAQRYDASENRVGSEFRANHTTTAGNQVDPSVTLLTNGTYVVSWFDTVSDDALLQRYSSSGARLGSEIRIFDAESPTISSLAGGGFVAVWERESVFTGYNLYTQRFDANGVKLGGEVLVNTTVLGDQVSGEAVGLAGGGYVIVWEASRQDGNGLGIYSQRFSASGSKLGVETRVNTSVVGDQCEPSVAALKNGGYVVAWQGLDSSQTGIFLQRYDSNGSKLGGQVRVNSVTSNDQEDPSVAVLSGGGFVVSWTSEHQDGDGYGIYAQRYDANGNRLGTEFRVNTQTIGDQTDSVVTALADGGYVISWTHSLDGGQTDIYSQRYDANGFKLAGINGDDASNTLVWDGVNSVIINGYAGNDVLKGNSGNDHLNAGSGNDILDGRTGNDRMTGGDGSDTYYVDSLGDIVVETNALAGTGGVDTVYSSLSSYLLGANVENGRILSSGSANLTGNSLNNVLYSGAGNNVLNGSTGTDTVSYAYAASAVSVNLAVATAQATGGSGNDTLISIENLNGSNYNDRLTGSGGINLLNGAAGNDTLSAGSGNDRLIGGAGKDALTGGTGNDIFDFNALSETGLVSTTRDIINDFVRGLDKIDLSTIDANSATATNDAFTAIIGSATPFTMAGQLKVVSGVLYGNTDADAAAEFSIQVTGITSLSSADFVL